MSPSSDLPTLFHLAREKLQGYLVDNGKCSLHRWVLLKNSILRASSLMSSDFNDCYDRDEPIDATRYQDSSMLRGAVPMSASESEWLDTLLVSLVDEEDVQVHPIVSLPSPQLQRERHGMPPDPGSSIAVSYVIIASPDQEDARYSAQLFTTSRETRASREPRI
ncbi:hypothetical protein F5887DRAFT_1080824 [Amanita rubescens]|nr:hypothetical protein F5887DRAFT_1080824 [Amanita rubescens]